MAVNSRICKACLGLVGALLILQSACLVSSRSGNSGALEISGLEADTMAVYPKGAAEIKCVSYRLLVNV